MAEVFRVVVPVDTMNVQSWQLAAAYALKMASQSSPASKDVVLLTHTKQQLGYSLADHLGATAVKALAKGRKAHLGDGVVMRHETLRTLGYSTSNTVVIAFYADDKMLETLDGQNGVAGIVAIPDFGGDVDQWIERWNPVVHGSKREETGKLIDDPVIEKALESITLLSNIAHGVLHPRDKDHANQVFRILRAKGHALDAGLIKSWAIRRGWKPGGATELAAVAEKVAKLKNKPSLAGIHDPAGRYERWSS